jgi:hypothetical protein
MNKFLPFVSILLLLSCDNKQIVTNLQVPGRDRYCEINANSESVIPNGRIIKPAGELIRISYDPFGLALSPDGTLALAVHNNLLTLTHLAPRTSYQKRLC